jgi:hypothetical protein
MIGSLPPTSGTMESRLLLGRQGMREAICPLDCAYLAFDSASSAHDLPSGAEPHQAAAISVCDVKTRTRLDVSQQRYCLSKGYFFFFLPVFFFALAFFAFLAMLPSTIPNLVQCKSFSTRTNVKYTTIAKLIPRVLNKVNGGHAVAGPGGRPLLR